MGLKVEICFRQDENFRFVIKIEKIPIMVGLVLSEAFQNDCRFLRVLSCQILSRVVSRRARSKHMQKRRTS